MDRINGLNTVDIGSGRRGWRKQNKAAGISGTEWTANFQNGLQEEILAVIEGAGLTPAELTWTQLRDAIGMMITSSIAQIGLRASGWTGYSGSASISVPTTDVGHLLSFGATVTAVDLPATSNFAAGEIYALENKSPSGADITVSAGGDAFSYGIYGGSGGVTSFKLAYTESALLLAVPSQGTWVLIGGSAAARCLNGAKSSLGSAGWKRIPDADAPRGYIIEQWAGATITTGGVAQTVTFPMAFPNAAIGIVGSTGNVGLGAGAGLTGSVSSGVVWCSGAGAVVEYRVWGY